MGWQTAPAREGAGGFSVLLPEFCSAKTSTWVFSHSCLSLFRIFQLFLICVCSVGLSPFPPSRLPSPGAPALSGPQGLCRSSSIIPGLVYVPGDFSSFIWFSKRLQLLPQVEESSVVSHISRDSCCDCHLGASLQTATWGRVFCVLVGKTGGARLYVGLSHRTGLRMAWLVWLCVRVIASRGSAQPRANGCVSWGAGSSPRPPLCAAT